MSATQNQELGLPHIQTCLPGTYNYVNHYNSIVRSTEGFILIGARNGILCYNGLSWKHITLKGDVHLLNHNDKITCWSRNLLGSVSFTPYHDPIMEISRTWDRGEIIKVLSDGTDLFILSSTGLFITHSGVVSEVPTGEKIIDIFYTGRNIISLSGEGSYFEHQGSRFVKTETPGGIELPPDKEGGLKLFFNSGSLLAFDPAADRLYMWDSTGRESDLSFLTPVIRDAGFNTATLLSDGQLAIATSRGGIILSAVDGSTVRYLRVEEGLYSNRIGQILADKSNNLWALHENAVSRIEIPSSFSFYGPSSGLTGNVWKVLRYDGIIYAASSTGLYKLRTGAGPEVSNYNFTRVNGIGDDVRCLEYTRAGLAAGTMEGLYLIDPQNTGSVTSLIRNEAINELFYVYSSELLLAGTDRGLRIFDIKTLKRIQIPNLPTVSIDDIALSPTGILWLSSGTGTVYRTNTAFKPSANLGFSVFTSENFSSPPGTYTQLLRTPNNLYFSTVTGLYSFDQQTNAFKSESWLNMPLKKSEYRLSEMINTPEKSIWILIDFKPGQKPGRYPHRVWMAKPDNDGMYDVRPLIYRRLNSRSINCLFYDQTSGPGGSIWLGTSRGIVRYDPDLEPEPETESRTYISGLYVADDSYSEQLAAPIRFPHDIHTLRFEFLSTDYSCESVPMYQYRLEGHSDEWSEWSLNSFAEFGGLQKGRYNFKVRSQDIYGNFSGADSYDFRIKSPPWSAWYAFVIYSIMVLLAIYYINKWITWWQFREQYHIEEVVQERTETLIREKEKSENLLANILPKSTAEELKSTGKATSSKFKMCTVLFSDIQGFTKIAEEMDADKLIDQLDRFYFHFDSVVEKYNIEKIKTIGDAYMAAGGIPIKNRTNPVEVVLAGLEMQQYMKELKKSKSDIWDLRIGIHTGSVIAGVVGHKKYTYDIWGDTVNTASRMESSGEPGRVNISSTTYKLIKDYFQCEFRGKMPVKYKGDIAMFFVNGLNPAYSESDRVTPNAKLFIQLQLLRLLDLEEFILERMEKELPEDLLFHNAEHTSHVYAQVELLGRGEKVGDEDLLLLRTAALLHDMGYIESDEDHENRSVKFAKEILPIYRYSEDQVNRICELILATTMPPAPKTLLEEIICDANLDHLGRVDFLIQSDRLFQEYRIRHKVKSKKEWNEYQVEFLESHDFYTSVAQTLREVSRVQQIENVRQYS